MGIVQCSANDAQSTFCPAALSARCLSPLGVIRDDPLPRLLGEESSDCSYGETNSLARVVVPSCLVWCVGVPPTLHSVPVKNENEPRGLKKEGKKAKPPAAGVDTPLKKRSRSEALLCTALHKNTAPDRNSTAKHHATAPWSSALATVSVVVSASLIRVVQGNAENKRRSVDRADKQSDFRGRVRVSVVSSFVFFCHFFLSRISFSFFVFFILSFVLSSVAWLLRHPGT
jgi:hypothetical protein